MAHSKRNSFTFKSSALPRKSSKANKNKPNIKSFKHEQTESSIFHQLDPSAFPVTKLDTQWMASSTTEHCSLCTEKIDTKFIGTKKRHCKKCGRVVCIPCSTIRIRKHRVCDHCNAFYLELNKLFNLWYKTNRNILHNICGYDSYTLETCASLKRILFILNHYHKWLLLKQNKQLSQKRQRNSKVSTKPPFDISHLSMTQFVDRLPKYDSQKFFDDVHHIKQMHFKNKQVFKMEQYQKTHQWELRAYSWKRIGKCDRWGCQYGIKDLRDDKAHNPNLSNGNNTNNDDDDTKENDDNDTKENDDDNNKETPPKKMKMKPAINTSQNGHVTMLSPRNDNSITDWLDSMHVILLHGVDDGDKEHEDSIERAKALYDLLPQTPLSPNMHAMGFFTANKKSKAPEELVGLANIGDQKATEAQTRMLDINQDIALSDIEYMDARHNTLCEWLEACSSRFDFFSTNANEWEAIQKKKNVLSDILDYLDMSEEIWEDEKILKAIIGCIRNNLFRSLPLTFRMLLNTPDYCMEDDSDEFEDPHYPHLCYIYEIALMFVRNINVDDKTRKKYLGKSLIIPLTELFASEDVREREYLKAILHGIYARNMRLRRLIRAQMSNCCYRVIYTESDNIENGVSECLQLVCSIIQGLTTPIKAEYMSVLQNVLIPLHRANARKLFKFHETLLACCIQFILKDAGIAKDILVGLLNFWPHQSPSKADMFLKEIVIIINTMMTDIDESIISNELCDEVILKIIECMMSENHCLAEKALLAFGEVGVQKLIDMNKQKHWPLILNFLFDNRDHKRHWCRPLDESYDDAMDTFVIRDSKSVQHFESIYKKEMKALNKKNKKSSKNNKQNDSNNNKKEKADIVYHIKPPPDLNKVAVRKQKWGKIEKMAKVNRKKIGRMKQKEKQSIAANGNDDNNNNKNGFVE